MYDVKFSFKDVICLAEIYDLASFHKKSSLSLSLSASPIRTRFFSSLYIKLTELLGDLIYLKFTHQIDGEE
jgi:hypothetical protein